MSTVDWLLLIGFGVAATIVVLGVLAIIAFVRWWIRGMDGHDEIARRQRSERS